MFSDFELDVLWFPEKVSKKELFKIYENVFVLFLTFQYMIFKQYF